MPAATPTKLKFVEIVSTFLLFFKPYWFFVDELPDPLVDSPTPTPAPIYSPTPAPVYYPTPTSNTSNSSSESSSGGVSVLDFLWLILTAATLLIMVIVPLVSYCLFSCSIQSNLSQ